MQVAESTIISDVRVAMDENTAITAFTDSDGTVIDTDTLEMEEIIKSKIADGVNAVRKAAPLSMLDLTRKASGEDWPVTWIDDDKCIGEVEIPEDYLKLVMFKMSDWAHAATTPIAADTALYHQQFSEWKGVRGNPSRPNIAIAADTTTGKDVIQFFSCDSTEATAELTYIKRCPGSTGSSENTGSYEIEAPIYRAMVLKVASLVAATYANGDLAQLLNQMAQEALG